ncbi:MAG: hypothetical protein O2913_13335 [Chloroflexi bacterium]|nr:hypothetical protein [Chloroflexota bacterium]
MARISAVSNAILASDFSQNMESWLTKTFNEGIPSIYDKSADAVYNATHIGGSQLHRLHDGSHTIWGMWDKVQEASPDDNPLQEVLGFLTAYGKDLSSHVGMPLFGMSRDTYQTLSNSLSDTFSIPKPWLQDLLHVNAVEVLGTSVATIALALRWDKATTEEFSRLAASLGISSIVSANPLLGVVTLAATAKAFWHPEKDGDYGEVVEGLAKGGIGTGLFLATSAVAPGPVWTGMLAGLCVGAVVNRATSKVHASDVSEFISRTMKRTVISEDSTDIENI